VKGRGVSLRYRGRKSDVGKSGTCSNSNYGDVGPERICPSPDNETEDSEGAPIV